MKPESALVAKYFDELRTVRNEVREPGYLPRLRISLRFLALAVRFWLSNQDACVDLVEITTEGRNEGLADLIERAKQTTGSLAVDRGTARTVVQAILHELTFKDIEVRDDDPNIPLYLRNEHGVEVGVGSTWEMDAAKSSEVAGGIHC